MPSNFVQRLFEFIDYNQKFFNIKVFVETLYLIDEARNILTEKAKSMQEKPDYVFYIDCDTIFKSDSLIKLVEADKDVISGMYFQRQKPYMPCVFKEDEHKTACFNTNYKPNSIIEVDFVGAGSLLIKMEALEKISYPYFYILRDNATHSTIGEDIVFCSKLRNVGYKIHLHTGVLLGHIGGYCIDATDWQHFYERKDYVPMMKTNIVDCDNQVKKMDAIMNGNKK